MEVRGVLLKGPDAPYVCSQVINGGWQLSAGHHPGRKEEDAILADLAAYHGGGITTFDMGDIYTGVEALVGQLVRSKRRSGEGAASLVQIHTKFVPDLDALLTIDAVHIRAVLARSCRRVGVVKLDLVQFHWWILEVGDFCATAKLLAQVGLEEGYARRIGLLSGLLQRLPSCCRRPHRRSAGQQTGSGVRGERRGAGSQAVLLLALRATL